MIEAAAATRAFSAGDIQRGLVDLNPDISFDAVVNRPSDNVYLLQDGDNMEASRGGVYHQGQYLCAMDRDLIGEHSVWESRPGYREIRMADIERYDDTRVLYFEILPTDPGYHAALLAAQRKHDNYTQDGDGKVFRYQALRESMVPYKVLHIGWRALFTQLVARGIPGINPLTIYQRFGVRL